MKVCCVECFRDPALRSAILLHGTLGTCPYCKSTSVACAPLDLVGRQIREGLYRAYGPAESEAGPYDPEDKVYLWGDPSNAPTLLEVLRDDEEIFADAIKGAESRLLEDLLSESAP